MSPEFPPALVPITIWEEIANGPSDNAVQFGPRLPLGRAKLSETVDARVVQVTAMLVTLAVPTVPDPLETAHCWLVGLVTTVTS